MHSRVRVARQLAVPEGTGVELLEEAESAVEAKAVDARVVRSRSDGGRILRVPRREKQLAAQMFAPDVVQGLHVRAQELFASHTLDVYIILLSIYAISRNTSKSKKEHIVHQRIISEIFTVIKLIFISVCPSPQKSAMG